MTISRLERTVLHKNLWGIAVKKADLRRRSLSRNLSQRAGTVALPILTRCELHKFRMGRDPTPVSKVTGHTHLPTAQHARQGLSTAHTARKRVSSRHGLTVAFRALVAFSHSASAILLVRES